MLSLFLLVQSAAQQPPSPPPRDHEFCVKTYSEHSPAPVDDSYIVIGTAPRSGKLYSGTLSSRFSQGRYVLIRKASGVKVTGEAWPVRCGPDKVPLLKVRYETKPAATQFFCKITVNYDNYSLANCGPNSNADQSVTGLEAWFPAPRSAP